MPHGGYRPGAGRKKKNVDATAHIRALAQQAVTDEVWLEIFKGLAKGARLGLLQNTALLLRYALGVILTADVDPPEADPPEADPSPTEPA